MPYRRKILIIEHDDFLREILGNILHKNGNYIINGFCVHDGIDEARGKKIDLAIVGTSCKNYGGKKSISYIRKELGPTLDIFILNSGDEIIDFIPKDKQMKISELSIKTLVKKLS